LRNKGEPAGDAGRAHPAIAVAEQHDVVQIPISNHVQHIGDVGFGIDRRVGQMGALAETGRSASPGDARPHASRDAAFSRPSRPTRRHGRPGRYLAEGCGIGRFHELVVDGVDGDGIGPSRRVNVACNAIAIPERRTASNLE
jgi:hypothetical protein